MLHCLTYTGSDDADGEGSTGPSLGWAKFGESLTLKGLKISATTMVLFEVYMSKPGVAGLPTQEVLVAWAVAPVLVNGQVRGFREDQWKNRTSSTML